MVDMGGWGGGAVNPPKNLKVVKLLKTRVIFNACIVLSLKY